MSGTRETKEEPDAGLLIPSRLFAFSPDPISSLNETELRILRENITKLTEQKTSLLKQLEEIPRLKNKNQLLKEQNTAQEILIQSLREKLNKAPNKKRKFVTKNIFFEIDTMWVKNNSASLLNGLFSTHTHLRFNVLPTLFDKMLASFVSQKSGEKFIVDTLDFSLKAAESLINYQNKEFLQWLFYINKNNQLKIINFNIHKNPRHSLDMIKQYFLFSHSLFKPFLLSNVIDDYPSLRNITIRYFLLPTNAVEPPKLLDYYRLADNFRPTSRSSSSLFSTSSSSSSSSSTPAVSCASLAPQQK